MKADLIKRNNLRFPENMYYEDNYAGPLWSLYYKHFELIDEPIYYYYQNATSTVLAVSMNKLSGKKEAKMIELCMKSTMFFYVYYSALWFYRRKIRK